MLHCILVGMVALAPVPPQASDGLTASPDGPEAVTVYFTEEEALAKVFGKKAEATPAVWTPTPDQRSELERRLGSLVAETEFPVWRGRRDGQDLGWALILEEKGRFKPITAMVHIRPDRTVGYALVMVYRESRGDGVKRQRFLKQFRGRDLEDRLRLNSDVVALTGATLSSRALAHVVRKALVLVDIHGGEAP
jgi:hypothetical protein